MQFLVTQHDLRQRRFEILGDEAFHIATVLRKRPGDVLRLFDGKGVVFFGEIVEASDARISGKILESPPQPSSATLSLYPIFLYQALPKGNKWDWILEKGCELQVASFIPLTTSRTIVKIIPSEVSKKLARWKKVLQAASKQCGTLHIPEVAKPISFEKALEELKDRKDQLILFCWESESAEPLAKTLGLARRKIRDLKQNQARVNIFIGPEGGWTIKEVEAAREADALIVSLGSTVLRAETAPIVAISMLKVLLDN